MKNYLKTLLIALMMILSSVATAQVLPNPFLPTSKQLMMTIKTHRYDLYGSNNNVTMSMMASAAAKKTNIEVDFGDGKGRIPYVINSEGTLAEDSLEEVISGGTFVSGSVGPEGIIRIYGTPTDIDYFDIHGTQVYDIDLSAMTNLSILELGHNEISKLDLTGMRYLEYLDVKDNPFDEGFDLGNTHPYLKYLNVNQMGDHALDKTNGFIDLSAFPALRVFTAWDSHCLKSIDPSKCQYLQQISIDNSEVKTIDVTKNTNLFILNVADCPINSIDLSGNPYLVEFYGAAEGRSDPASKFTSIDFTHNPFLQRISIDGNLFTTIDVSKQSNLVSLSAANNKITSVKGLDIDETERPDSLASLDLSGNYLTFKTLPEVDNLTYFYYDLQHPMPVAKEIKVGEPLKLADYLLHPGTTTGIYKVCTYSRDGYSNVTDLVSGVDYTYDRKKAEITFLRAQTDSVSCTFINDLFSDVALSTTMFIVSSEEDFGKPVEKFSVIPDAGTIALNVTTREDATLNVDFGDGIQKEFQTKANTSTTISGNAVGAVRVFGTIPTAITQLEIADQKVNYIDVSQLTSIQGISITGTNIKDIDLTWNHELKSINLSNNKICKLDLSGANDAFHKNKLTYVNVSGNGMTEFDPGLAKMTITELNASNNNLHEIKLDDMEYVTTLNLSNNALTEINIGECYALRNCDLSGNSLSAIEYSACTNMQKLDISHNNFTLATLPAAGSVLVYAPQNAISIASKAMSIDLSAQAKVNSINTRFSWIDATTGVALVEGTDYEINNGITKFLEPASDKTVYATMSNIYYPQFSGQNILRTTPVVVTAALPEYIIAEFTTPKGGQSAGLSLAGTKPNTFIYIDWGDGDLKEYQLQDTYKLFNATTIAGATVRIYSNDASHGNMHVFAIGGVTIGSIDVSKMTELYTLTISNASLESIDITHNTKLHELNLENNWLESLDLSKNKELTFVVLNDNYFDNLEFVNNPNIGWLAAARCGIKNINTSSLAGVDVVDLTGNELSAIDVSPMRNLTQLSLAENHLKEIDLSKNERLIAVDLSTNEFTFQTLPLPVYNVYFYGDQKDLEVKCVDGIVDLSSQAVVHDSISHYYFFDGEIIFYYDENGNMEFDNKEYEQGVDFFVDGGKVRFQEAHTGVSGLITNPLFPNLMLYTKLFDVTANPNGIESIYANDPRHTVIYDLAGRKVNAKTVKGGIYIKNGQKYVR